MPPTAPLRPGAAAALLLVGLAACSDGSSPIMADPPANDPAPDDPACASILEGGWTFTITSVTEVVTLENAPLTQNGCLVFVEQGDYRLTGTLVEGESWSVQIVFDGEQIGGFAGAFSEELDSPLYLFSSENDGNLDSQPIVSVEGRFEPGGLSISSLTPGSGTLLGGTEVEIGGGGFLDYELQFVVDGNPAELLEKVGNETALVLTPPGFAAGLVDVTVLTADEDGGKATTSATAQEAFEYLDCSNVEPGEWTLALNGTPRAATPATADCVLTFTLAVESGQPTEVLSGPIDLNGGWTLEYLVDGALAGNGSATLSGGDPADALVGTITLTAGGTLSLSGQAPPPPPEEEE